MPSSCPTGQVIFHPHSHDCKGLEASCLPPTVNPKNWCRKTGLRQARFSRAMHAVIHSEITLACLENNENSLVHDN